MDSKDTKPKLRERAEEQKNSEAVAREGEERFQAIINTAPALIWMSGPDKACTYVNKTWLDFTGRSMEAELASSWAEGIHPDDLQRCMDTYTQSFDRREKFRTEYRLRRHDGEYRWVLDEGVPRFNQDGSLVGYIGIGIDITDRELAEREIKLANDRLRLAMESGKSVAWEWDVQSGRDSWFGDLKTMFGIPSDTYVGHVEDFRRRVHSEDRVLVWKAINDAMRGHAPYAAEFRVVWPDGTVRWVAANGKFYYSKEGKPERMLGVASDITDSKKTELALRESEERFRLAAQAGKMYTFDWEVATDVIVRSEGAAQILGADEGPRTTGQHLLTMIPPEDRDRLIAAIAQLTPEEPNLRIRYRIIRSDGAVIWVDRTSRAYFDDKGKVQRIVGMIADITDRVRAEEALRQKDRELSEAQRLARLGSWHWDARNDIVTWSEELYRLAGLNPNVPPPSYKELPRFYTAESWERLQRAVEKALRSGTPYELDLEIVRPDGITRWIRTRGEAVGDATGLIVGLRGTGEDITERKLADDKLQEYERAVEGLEEMMVVIDREYRYLIANNKFLKMRNMTQEQVVGRFAHEVLNKGVFETVVKEKLDECFQGKVVRYEMKYTYPELARGTYLSPTFLSKVRPVLTE
jgi:PAS domain S-box-containing protein